MMYKLRRIGAIWGVAGVVILFCFAVWRLAPFTYEALRAGLSIWQWVLMLAWCAFMVFTEGYDGIGKRLAPRVVERAVAVRENGDLINIFLAPLYCLGYFRAPLKRLFVSYAAIILIIIAVTIVHQLAQPWRGIIDAGVVAGLSYGAGVVLYKAGQVLFKSPADHKL